MKTETALLSIPGEYSCLKVELIFKREFSYYLITIYVPCCMLVIVSWVSFWLDQNAIPARVSLGVTTLLTMSTQTSGINAQLPPVSYTKAIDVWTGVRKEISSLYQLDLKISQLTLLDEFDLYSSVLESNPRFEICCRNQQLCSFCEKLLSCFLQKLCELQSLSGSIWVWHGRKRKALLFFLPLFHFFVHRCATLSIEKKRQLLKQ